MLSQKETRKLKIANLFLAIWLSTVPTGISYGIFGLHGLNVCRSLVNATEITNKTEIKAICDKSAWNTTKDYIFLIGFFITLPTWFWFYMSMKKKKEGTQSQEL